MPLIIICCDSLILLLLLHQGSFNGILHMHRVQHALGDKCDLIHAAITMNRQITILVAFHNLGPGECLHSFIIINKCCFCCYYLSAGTMTDGVVRLGGLEGWRCSLVVLPVCIYVLTFRQHTAYDRGIGTLDGVFPSDCLLVSIRMALVDWSGRWTGCPSCSCGCSRWTGCPSCGCGCEGKYKCMQVCLRLRWVD